MNNIRQCFVCSSPVPSEPVGWEVFKPEGEYINQYRCPKHRVLAPRQLATLGDKIALNKQYGRFGK